MLDDGDFVLVDRYNKTKWSTSTSGNPGAGLIFGPACNLLIISASGKQLWSSGNTCGNI